MLKSNLQKPKTRPEVWPGVAKRAVLMLFLVFGCVAVFSHHVFAAVDPNDPQNYPNIYTAPGVAKPPNSNSSSPHGVLANIGTVSTPRSSNPSDGAYYLYDQNGDGSYNSYNGGPVWRSSGLTLNSSAFEIILPSFLIGTGNPHNVTIVDACQILHDVNGWEDSRIKNEPSYSPADNRSVVQSMNAFATLTVVNGTGYGVNLAVQTPQVRCGGGNNLTVAVPDSYFQNDPRFPGFASAAVIVNDDNNSDSAKNFSVSGPPNSFVSPISTSTTQYPNSSSGSTYDPNPAGNGEYGMTLFNPAAGYFYNPAGPCQSGGNTYPANCIPTSGVAGATQGGYGSMNQEVDSVANQIPPPNTSSRLSPSGQPNPNYSTNGGINTFDFYFSPDCAYDTAQAVWLKWARGTSATQTPSNREHWALVDMNTGATISSAQLDMFNATDSVNVGLLTKGHVYDWKWTGVNRAHGVTVWLPFSSFAASSSFQNISLPQCPPTNPVISVSCSTITVTSANPATQYYILFAGADGDIKQTGLLSGSRTWNTFADFRSGGNTPLSIIQPSTLSGGQDAPVLWPSFNYLVSLRDPAGNQYDGGGLTDLNGGPCMQVQCSVSITTSPDISVEPGASTNLTYGVTVSAPYMGGSYQTPYGLDLSGSPGVTINPATAVWTYSNLPVTGNPGPPIPAYTPGYGYTQTVQATINFADTVSAQFTWYGVPIFAPPCTTSYTPATRPFLEVKNGDISTGGGFKDSSGTCQNATYIAPNTSGNNYAGGIRTFASSPVPNASGADFAAYALGLIDGSANNSSKYGFYSSVVPGGNPDTLEFADTADISSGYQNSALGGVFGGELPAGPFVNQNAHCAIDYFGSTQLDPSQQVNLGSPPAIHLASLPPSPSTQYTATVPSGPPGTCLHVSSGPTGMPQGAKITLYVKGGNVCLDIIAYNTSWSFDNNTYTNNAPYFALIVQGNILVEDHVSELDGFYVAQPLASDPVNTGIFSTCAVDIGPGRTGFYRFAIPSDEPTTCSAHQLLVDGAVVAEHIYPTRSSGTLASGGPVAETFNLIPSVLVGQPGFKSLNGSSAVPGTLDSLTNLPPIF